MSLLRGAGPRRPDLEPLELDDTRVVAAGTVLWLLALPVLAVAALLGDGVHAWQLWTCVAGAVLGVLGLRYIARRKAARREAARRRRRS